MIDEFNNNTDLFQIIGQRTYPRPIDLQAEHTVFPLLAFELVGGVPDNAGYPAGDYIFDFKYVSEEGLQESWQIYEKIYAIINRKSYRSAGVLKAFEVQLDTLCLDASQVLGGKLLYILSNTWRIKTIGS